MKRDVVYFTYMGACAGVCVALLARELLLEAARAAAAPTTLLVVGQYHDDEESL